MKIPALKKETRGTTAGQFRPYLRAEAARAYELYQLGILRELYFNQEQDTAVLMLECAGPDEARSVLSALPLVQAGLITFELIPLAPYPGFSRLFKQRAGVSGLR